jgi:hypothetical protein
VLLFVHLHDAFGAGVNVGLRIADRLGLEGMIWGCPPS